MKLNELKKKINTSRQFKKARDEVRHDLAFAIAHEIETLRLTFGLSQSQFARKVGLTQPAVARLERGSLVPSLTMLKRVADAFNLQLVLPTFSSERPSSEADSETITSSAQTGESTRSPYFATAESLWTENSLLKRNTTYEK